MDLSKKFLHKVKPIFRKKASHAERPLENDISPDYVLIARQPGQSVAVGTTRVHRPESPGERNGGTIQVVRVASTPMGSRDNSATLIASHSDRERVIGTTDNSEVGVIDSETLQRQFIDGEYPNNQQELYDMEEIQDFRGINPSTSDNRNRRAAAVNDNDRELLVPLRQPPMGHSSPESMRFEDTNYSGISVGGGPVHVRNEIHNHNPSERIRPGLKLLKERVATSAFHNSAQRVDPPRCHENTRVAILKQISDWILLDRLARHAWIMWVHGAAGGGKSAIMQSIAELCEQAYIPLASFFFLRPDLKRNSMAGLVATLVYQLIQLIPQVQDEILGIIESNPLIFDQSLKSQLEKLIIYPLFRARDHFKGFFVILIDGLDECIERAHQVDLIQLLGAVSDSRIMPVIFLVASRREPQIEAAFGKKQGSDLVLTLPLDNSDVEQTSDDIRRFLIDRFKDISETHLRRHLLPTYWPPVSVVNEIVTKSSGQFIFASVVMNYVSSPRSNPAHLLEIVRGIRPRGPSSQNPFAHLDSLYQYIFSQVEALDQVLDILAYILISELDYPHSIEFAFLLGAGGLEVCFADLLAVIKIEGHDMPFARVKFLHASLPDFLRDKTRSEQYHIDFKKYIPKLLCMFLDRVPPKLDRLSPAQDLDIALEHEHARLIAIRILSSRVSASDRLRQSFLNTTVCVKLYEDHFERFFVGKPLADILRHLEQLNFDDQGETYQHVLEVFATELAKYWSLLARTDKSHVKNAADLFARISQICQEDL